MPERFPVLNEKTGELVDTPHYSVDELAAMLHLHPSTVHRLMAREHWPHLVIAHRVWFAPDDVTAALASMRRNDGAHVPDTPRESPGIGLALPPDDDADGGGIR